jgi:hypothetical protein
MNRLHPRVRGEDPPQDPDATDAGGGLTAAKRRVLTGHLRHIEGELALVERALGLVYDGVLTSFVDDVDDLTRARLGHGLQEARELIREARDRVALDSEQVPLSRWAAAHLGMQSLTAEECESGRLAGYGRIPPGLAERLDPLMTRLSALLFEMQRSALATRRAGDRRAR